MRWLKESVRRDASMRCLKEPCLGADVAIHAVAPGLDIVKLNCVDEDRRIEMKRRSELSRRIHIL